MRIFLKSKPKIIAEFGLYLYDIKNYSDNTIKSYTSDLINFFNFFKEYHNLCISIYKFDIFILANVKIGDIYAFLVYLNSINNSASTRKRKIICLKVFFDWLFSKKYNINKINPANNIRIIQYERLPKYLDLNRCKSIINVFNSNNSKYFIRNNTIIFLFLNSGIRISELKNLNIEDVNLSHKFIYIKKGKRAKDRYVFFNDKVSNYLVEYLNYRKRLVSSSNALFLSKSNLRISINGIELICKNAYKLANLEHYNYTTHTLRHSFATLMYQYGNVDIRILQNLLGHSSINSTEIYTHLHSEILKNAVEHNPLNLVA